MSKYYVITPETLTINNFISKGGEVLFTAKIEEFGYKIETGLTVFMNKVVEYWEATGIARNFNESTANVYYIRKAETANTVTVKLTNDVLKAMLVLVKRRLQDCTKQAELIINEIKTYARYNDYNAATSSVYGLCESRLVAKAITAYIEALEALISDKSKVLYVAETERTKDEIIRSARPFLQDIGPAGKKLSISSQYKVTSLKNSSINSSNALTAEYNTFNTIFQNRRVNYRHTICITKLIIENKPKETVIDLKVVYPEFDAHIQDFGRIFSTNFSRHITPNGRLHNMINGSFDAVFTRFNNIKVKLIFLGYGEEEAVKLIIDKALKDTSINKHGSFNHLYNFTLGICELTKQLLPSIFLSNYLPYGSKESKLANYYFMTWVANRRVTRYAWADDRELFKEQILDQHSCYDQSVGEYNNNVLNYLTPRSMPKENVKSFGGDKVFQGIPYLGVELEVERAEKCAESITEEVLNDLGKDFVILKRDGSLGGHKPFEIVTVPATLETHKARWASFMDNKIVKPQLSSFKSGRCGMHVHISRDCFTGLHLAKFLRFINHVDNGMFVHKLAGRGSTVMNVYTDHANPILFGIVSNATPIKQQLAALKHCARIGVEGGRGGHRDTVSTTSKHGTIEVRIFRGNLAKSHFYKNIEFVHALWSYTKDCGMRDLDYKDFILWLFKDNCSSYNNLQAWLIASGYNVSNRNTDTKETEETIKRVRLIVNKKYNTGKDDKLRNSKQTSLKSELLANF